MNIQLNPPVNFLEEETRLGYTISTEMKKVWAIQIDLVHKVLEVCEKHNLRIYADGGTLLGTIRHKGYIPWDDDIDMVMFREDYDKLMQLTDEFPHPYFLQNVYTDPHYTHRHAQIRNSKTACWQSKDNGCIRKYNQGIFVDIFPIDYIPKNPRAFSRYYKKEGLAKQKFRLIYKLSNLLPNKIYRWIRNHIPCLSDKNLMSKYENILRSIKPTLHGNGCKISVRHNCPIQPLDSFGNPVFVDFEYIKIPIPQEAHKVLELIYGKDYMIPKHISTTHGSMTFDTEHSYIDLIRQ